MLAIVALISFIRAVAASVALPAWLTTWFAPELISATAVLSVAVVSERSSMIFGSFACSTASALPIAVLAVSRVPSAPPSVFCAAVKVSLALVSAVSRLASEVCTASPIGSSLSVNLPTWPVASDTEEAILEKSAKAPPRSCDAWSRLPTMRLTWSASCGGEDLAHVLDQPLGLGDEVGRVVLQRLDHRALGEDLRQLTLRPP